MSNYFLKSVSKLAGGTASAQLINLLSLPVITRLYSPSDFGVFALFTMVVAILGVFTTCKYENAIIAVEDEHDAFYCVYLVLFISIFMSSFLYIISLLIVSFIDLDIEGIYFTLFASYIGIIFSSAYLALYYWNNRFQNYTLMTKGRILGAITVAILTLSYGFFEGSYKGLIIGSLVGMFVNFIYLYSKGNSLNRFGTTPSFLTLRLTAKKLNRFPKFLVLSSFLDRLSSQFHIAIFTKFFGADISGSIAIHNKAIGLPTAIIANSVGDVFKRKASDFVRDGLDFRKFLFKTAFGLFVIAFPIFCTLFFFAPQLFVFVFGEEWLMAGEFSQFLAFNFLVAFIVSPIANVIYLGNNQKYDLYVQLLLITMLTLGMSYSVNHQSLDYALYTYAISYLVKYVVEFYICYRISKGNLC